MASSSSRSDVIKELLVIRVLYMISISTTAVYHVGTVKMYITGLVSFLPFICYVASTTVALMTVPLIERLWARFTFFAYSTKLNEQMKGLLCPLLVLGFVSFDFYLIFNNLTKFREKGEPTGETEAQKSDDEELDSDSD